MYIILYRVSSRLLCCACRHAICHLEYLSIFFLDAVFIVHVSELYNALNIVVSKTLILVLLFISFEFQVQLTPVNDSTEIYEVLKKGKKDLYLCLLLAI